MEKRWLALAQSYEFTERLTDFTGASSNWLQGFNERRRIGKRPDEAPRLRRTIQDSSVDALLERMWLSSIVEFCQDAIHSNNLDDIITSWNKGAERVYGYFAEEAIGQPVVIIVPPDRQHEEYIISERVRRGERIEHFETVRRRKDESLIDVSLSVSPMRDAEGKIVGVSRIARDITDRKRSEAQISILAREAEHRAKNLLANVDAMMRLSNSDTADGLKETIRGRIRALANVHSLFVQSRWTGAELGSLVKQELSPYARPGEMRTLSIGPTVILKPDAAQAMADYSNLPWHTLTLNDASVGGVSWRAREARADGGRDQLLI